jgi:hypothetical protein
VRAEELRAEDVRAAPGVDPGVDAATVCVRNASLLTAPQAGQKRALSETSPPQEPHFTINLLMIAWHS